MCFLLCIKFANGRSEDVKDLINKITNTGVMHIEEGYNSAHVCGYAGHKPEADVLVGQGDDTRSTIQITRSTASTQCRLLS